LEGIVAWKKQKTLNIVVFYYLAMVTKPLGFKKTGIFILVAFLSIFFLSGCTFLTNSLNDSQLEVITSVINNISRNLPASEGKGIYSELEEQGILSNQTKGNIVLLNFSNVTIPLNKEYEMPFKAFCNGVEIPIKYYSPVSREGKITLNDSSSYIIESQIKVECLGETKVYEYLIKPEKPNNPPTIRAPNEVAVLAGRSMKFFYYVYDLDSDFVNFWIDGWKTSLDYTPTLADVGTHKIFLHASDGENHIEKTVLVHVINGDYSNFFQLNIFRA
jgi:hypothetical protein